MLLRLLQGAVKPLSFLVTVVGCGLVGGLVLWWFFIFLFFFLILQTLGIRNLVAFFWYVSVH